MFLAKKLLSALLLPPAGPILLAFVGLWLAGSESRRWRTAGRWLAGLSLAGLLVLSMPAVSDLLHRMVAFDRPVGAEAMRQAQAIVVLGAGVYRDAPEYGGDSLAGAGLERVRYGAHLARSSKLPVLVTGGAPFGGRPEGEVMAEIMAREFGVAPRWIENRSRDTAENASLSAPLLKQQGIRRVLLVSHASHLPRAIPLFEKEGLTVIPAPTIIPARQGLEVQDFLPNAGALRGSASVLHELLGQLFNKLSGQT